MYEQVRARTSLGKMKLWRLLVLVLLLRRLLLLLLLVLLLLLLLLLPPMCWKMNQAEVVFAATMEWAVLGHGRVFAFDSNYSPYRHGRLM
jgi:hypothetical protein